MTGDRLVDAAAVAERLSVKESWVREHTRNGDIPHKQLGRYIRYDLGEVDAWLERQSSGGDRSPRRGLRAA